MKKILKKGIFVNLPIEIIDLIKKNDPTGQNNFANGILYIVRLLRKLEQNQGVLKPNN
jgi:hypothetical protein